MKLCSFSGERTNHKNTVRHLTAFYLILKHIIMELKYKIPLFLQAWNEITADNQENLEKKTKQNKTTKGW